MFTLVPASQLGITFGALFLSVIFTTFLYGVGCIQLYFFYENYWNIDPNWLKAYIFLLWLLDTAQHVLVVVSGYTVFVKGIIDPGRLIALPKTVVDVTILTAIVDAMSQAMFVRRAWYISNKNHILVGTMCATVLAQFVVNTTYFGQMYNLSIFPQFVKIVRTERALNCITAFTDTYLALVLIWLLWRSRSGIQRTDSILNRLIMYTVGSGLITSLWAISALISSLAAPQSFIYLLADLVIPKLYFNCLLAAFNARSRLRKTPGHGAGGVSIRLENLDASASSASDSTDPTVKTPVKRAITCRVDTDIEVGITYDQPEKVGDIREPIGTAIELKPVGQ